MDFCTLRPPNHRFLSDDIVGGVLQRGRSEKYSLSDYNSNTREDEHWHQTYRQPQTYEQPRAHQVERSYPTKPCSLIPQRYADAVLGLLSLTSGTKRKREQTPNFTSCKSRSVRLDSNKSQGETDTESLNNDKQERVWPIGQEKYQPVPRRVLNRKKEDDQMIWLEKETRLLREEIKKFEQRRLTISKAVSRHENGWDVALEYFKLFRFGLHPPGRGRPSKHKQTDIQLDFLRSAMTSGVVFNSGQGPDGMLRSWKRMSMWFQDWEQEMEVLDRGAAGSLAAMTRTSVTITERALHNVFLHLMNTNGTHNKLAERLAGQRIVMRGLTRFEWNSEIGRFTSVVAHSDLLTPLLKLLGNVEDDLLTPMVRLLGNLEDVSRVFEGSTISLDFRWKPTLNEVPGVTLSLRFHHTDEVRNGK